MDKICAKCGYKYDENIKFCTNCGVRLDEQSPPEPSTPETTQPEPIIQPIPKHKPKKIKQLKPPSSREKNIPSFLGIIALILAIIALILPFALQSEPVLKAGAVDTSKLANNTVTSEKIADSAIKAAHISAQNITGDHIIRNAIDFSHLANDVYDTITGTVDIADNSITSTKIVNFSITSQDIENNSITSTKIPDAAVGSSEIDANAVGASEIASDAVGSSEIAASAVGASELANNAVTYDKMSIKIKYGLATDVIDGTSVSHGLGSTPSSVILTPVFNSTLGNPLHANVFDVTSSDFQIALWQDVAGSLIAISSSEPQSVYWIAVYS